MSDHIHDKSLANLVKLAQCVELPEYVKTAEVNDPEDLKELPKEAFADPSHRLFPIHTKADTWASAAYFYKYGSALSGRALIEEMLKKAIDLWDIPAEEFAKLQDLNPSNEKVASAPEHLVQLTHDDKVIYKTAIQTPDDLKKLADNILSETSKYTYDLRKQAAEQILELDKELNASFDVDTKIDLEKTAGVGSNTSSNVAILINNRAIACRDLCPEMSAQLTKLAKDVSYGEGFMKSDRLQKIARILDVADRLTDFNVRYNDTFRPPELDVFKYTETILKTAKDGLVPLKNGSFLNKTALEDNSKELRPLFEEVFNVRPVEPSDFVKLAAELSSKEADILVDVVNSL